MNALRACLCLLLAGCAASNDPLPTVEQFPAWYGSLCEQQRASACIDPVWAGDCQQLQADTALVDETLLRSGADCRDRLQDLVWCIAAMPTCAGRAERERECAAQYAALAPCRTSS